jgi:hypothetical protein
MRALPYVVAIMSIVLGTPLRGQKVFEGTISYDVDMGARQMQLSMSARGNKVRQEMQVDGAPYEMRGMYQILDYSSGDIVTVLPQMKRYMLLNFRKLRESSTQSGKPGDQSAKMIAGINATGKKESVAGLDCEVYVMDERPGDEWCITTALGHFLGFEGDGSVSGSNPSPVTSNPAVAELMKKFKQGAVILRMRMAGRDGRDMTMTATKIDRTAPPRENFAVPPGFEEMKNPMMP